MNATRKKVRSVSEGLVLALILVLVTWGTHAFADPADDAGPDLDRIQQRAREIQRVCETPEGEALVRKNLRERFGLTDEGITELRERGLGYGEIGILESLSQASGRDSAELLRLRTEEKMGWGQIAKQANTTVGAAHQYMKGLGEAGAGKVMTEKAGRLQERMDKPGKESRPEKAERPERPEKPERPMKPERPGKF